MFTFFSKKIKEIKTKSEGLSKNPFFYLGLFSSVLLLAVCFGSSSFSDFNSSLKNSDAVFFNPFFKNSNAFLKDSLFFSQNQVLALETPDLKTIEENYLYAVSTPRVLTTKVLGDVFGQSSQNRNDIIEYSVQPGDTVDSIAKTYDISVNTLLWTNSIAKSSTLKVGQTLVILPVSGVVHIVKSGDTLSAIAKTYKASLDETVNFNSLSNESDIYIGDLLVIPNGTMPSKAQSIYAQAPVADSFFIFPTEGQITQGLHWYNAVDVANKCGTPIYAAASGQVQRVRYGYNFGGGNYITILHSGGIVTYYGHLMTIFVKPGDAVAVGDRIALMGGGAGMAGAGISTGCHLHFEVVGAKNPLSKYYFGSQIKYAK